MINKIRNSILYLFILTTCVYSQEKNHSYYGIKYFTVIVDFSDDALPFQDILPDNDYINNIVKSNTDLTNDFRLDNSTVLENIIISVRYSINKNRYTDEQYYGSHEVSISRIFDVPNSTYTSSGILFARRLLFVYNYPIKTELQKDIKQGIKSLINEFIVQYYNTSYNDYQIK